MAGPAQPPPPSVALGAPQAAVEHPVAGAQLAPGQRYRFPDVVPGRLDVEFTAPAAPVFTDYESGSAYVSEDDVFQKVVLDFQPVGGMRIFTDPYIESDDIVNEVRFRTVTAPAPDDLLGHFARLPFAEIVQSERPVTIGGIEGRAVDLRFLDLGSDASACGPNAGKCVNLFAISGTNLISTTELNAEVARMILLDLPSGRMLLTLYPASPVGEEILRTVAFVARPLPAELGPAHYVPFGDTPMSQGQRYGIPDLAGTVAAAFTPTSAMQASVLGDELALSSPDSDGDHLYFAPTTALRAPAPDSDPRLVGPGPGRGSTLPAGPIDWITGQPWAEVLDAPRDTLLGGAPARAVDIRVSDAAPTLPCNVDTPTGRPCALVLVNGLTGHPVSVDTTRDRTLRVIEATVGRTALTLITTGPGTATADTLRLEPR